ncbi:MAG: nickel pincer cofactor biosynthesis protein LarC [Candidatus Omnitrophota bacterium]
MRIAYFDCFSGISGDMTIAAFLDAGLKLSVLSRELKKLKLGGYRISARKVKRGEMSGTKFDCVATKRYAGHRKLEDIMAAIRRSALKPRVKALAGGIFDNIGKAEAKIHGSGKKNVWLHELGSVDSIVDIVGAAIAIDAFGIDEVYASRVNMGGSSFMKTAHGSIPMPAPAALELLKGAPVQILDVGAELVTPTGAGILKTISKGFGAMPPMVVSGIGYGAGTKEMEGSPNMLRVVIGSSDRLPFERRDDVVVVETNIDDMNPQHFEYVFEKLFSSGALDVYSSNIQMKKARPAVKLSAICAPEDLDKISSVIFSETTTIGVRFYTAGRFKLERRTVTAKTKYGRVRVKIIERPGGMPTAAPEYDDCKKLASAGKVPIREVSDKAREAAYGML